jgi:hypothetical protein
MVGQSGLDALRDQQEGEKLCAIATSEKIEAGAFYLRRVLP